MKLFDTRIPIHETEDGLPTIHELIGKLGEMLDTYKIDYFVSLPTRMEIEADKKQLTYMLHCMEEQNTEITLVIALFARLYLKRDNGRILDAITKSFKTAC